MYSPYFSHVIAGEIKATNIKRGGKFKDENGVIRRLGSNSPGSTYLSMGLYPQVKCPCDECGPGQTIHGPTYSFDPETMTVLQEYCLVDTPEPEMVAAARTRLSNMKHEHEGAGLIIAGVNVSTDWLSIGKLDKRAAELSKKTVGTTINWKIPGDGCMLVTSDTLKSWQEIVSEYTQACIDRECELIPLVEADPTTDITGGWPSKEIE